MAERVRIKLEDAIKTAKKTVKGRNSGVELEVMEKGRTKTGGRVKGTPNKVTVILKDGIMAAMEKVGADNRGKDGVTGYLAWMARRHPGQFSRLIEKLLPYQLTGKDGGPMQMEHTTKEQLVQRLKERGLPVPASLMDAPSPSQSAH